MSNPQAPEIPRLATRYTPDGEVPVAIRGETVEALPIPKMQLKGLPAGFSEVHADAMHTLSDLVERVKEINRAFPVLYSEFLAAGVPRKIIRKLCTFGFIKKMTIEALHEGSLKKAGSRSVVFFTPLGHAYLRSKDYGDTKTV